MCVCMCMCRAMGSGAPPGTQSLRGPGTLPSPPHSLLPSLVTRIVLFLCTVRGLPPNPYTTNYVVVLVSFSTSSSHVLHVCCGLFRRSGGLPPPASSPHPPQNSSNYVQMLASSSNFVNYRMFCTASSTINTVCKKRAHLSENCSARNQQFVAN